MYLCFIGRRGWHRKIDGRPAWVTGLITLKTCIRRGVETGMPKKKRWRGRQERKKGGKKNDEKRKGE